MDNADLEKLKVSQGKLAPKFKASVTSYSVTVGSNVEEIKLSPLTADGGASYIVKGADSSKVVKLTEGKTAEVEILVTAEDGTSTKSYTVLMRRLSADDATLAQLDVSAGALQPPFSPLVTKYECSLPSGVDSLSLRVKTEDAKMSVAMKDGSPVETVQLNPGNTLVEINVTSVSGKTTSTYTVMVSKNRLPPTLQLKSKDSAFECAVCCNVAHLPSRIKGSSHLYCSACLEELTRTNKTDPFTGKKLDKEGWLHLDLACDADLATQMAVCSTVEATMQQIGAKLLAERLKTSKAEEPTESCADCSKKVPAQDMALHKELLCPSKHTISLPKKEVKSQPWEHRLVDESCGNDVQTLLQKGKEWETKYIQSLPKPGVSPHDGKGPGPLDCLQTAARCYGTALKSSPRCLEAHLALGLVMEEFFYAEDLFGLKKAVPDTGDEGEAEISSKEEEFLAICQLHGVTASAPLALQLKAVEAEYHSLKESGQTHKAEHVQSLHAWKSKKALQASQGSYAADTDSPLSRAKLKFQDSCSIKTSDAIACFHLGRLCLLLGEKEEAVKYLKMALAQKPTHSPSRFCLGLALGPADAKYAEPLLCYGLTQYLIQIQELHETQADMRQYELHDLHSKTFYRSTNTLIIEGFLHLASMGGHGSLSDTACLLSATSCLPEASIFHRESTYRQLLWTSLKARSMLLSLLHKANKKTAALQHCQQLSALIARSGLKASPELRALQMQVFQLGVELQPSSSKALCHLGNGQLAEHEATGEQEWLHEAELSFRASISMEGQPITQDNIPGQLSEQKWWKKKMQPKSNESETKTTTPTNTTTGGQKVAPKGPTATKQPATGPRAGTQAGRGRGGASQPAANRKPTGPAASKQPAKPVGRGSAAGMGTGSAARPGQAAKTPAAKAGGKNVATLGELKTGTTNTKKPATTTPSKSQESVKTTEPAKPANTASPTSPTQPPGKVEINEKTYLPRLGLARILAKSSTDKAKLEESHSLYKQVISMSPDLHDAYIELGEMLSKTDPVAAVDAYARFPFSDPPSFNDAYLHGEILGLLMASENYDDPRLLTSMVAMGRALGIGVLEKQVSILENKFKTDLLKKVYSGVHGKPIDDPDLQAFFKFKCWR